MNIPFTYLEIPIRENPKKIGLWDTMIQKIKKRLTRWKGKILTSANRVCLIKSTLNFLPLFYLSFFKASKMVITETQKIQRKNLMGIGIRGKENSLS